MGQHEVSAHDPSSDCYAERRVSTAMSGSYEDAKSNFYLAARYGLNAQFAWFGGRRVPAVKLILNELLPLARTGLRQAGICSEDLDRYLGVIEDRVRMERTRSQWVPNSLSAMGSQRSREAQHRCLTAAMLRNQQTGDQFIVGHLPNSWPAPNQVHRYQ